MKHILFITPHFPPSDGVGTQRIVKFIKYLNRGGWKIFVLTLSEKWYEGAGNNYEFYLPKEIKVIRIDPLDLFNLSGWIKQKWQNLSNRVNIATKTKPIEKNGYPPREKGGFLYGLKEFITGILQYPDRFNGFSLLVFRMLKIVLRKYQIEYVVASSPPHSVNITLNFLRRLYKFIYIADFRDPWALSQWDVEKKTLIDKLHRWLDRHFERHTIKIADIILFNTEFLKNLYVKHYDSFSFLNRKSYIITNGFDPEVRFTYERIAKEQKQNTFSKIRILHTGTLYKKRNPQIILEGLAAYLKKHPEQSRKIEIVFVGSVSPTLSFLYDLIDQLQLTDQIYFEPFLPYQKVMEKSHQVDWLLLLQPNTSVQVPAKFFDYLLVNKPIWGVLEIPSIGQKMIEELQVGYVSDCRSRDAIVQFFEYVFSEQSHSFAPDVKELKKYSMPYIVKQLEKILDKYTLHGVMSNKKSE